VVETTRPKARYNLELMVADMTLRGWNDSDLADKAALSKMTVSRFMTGKAQTARVAKKLAGALGRSVSRYLVRVESAA
jgi:transcriptional regulator with XRE-family HTH domain